MQEGKKVGADMIGHTLTETFQQMFRKSDAPAGEIDFLEKILPRVKPKTMGPSQRSAFRHLLNHGYRCRQVRFHQWEQTQPILTRAVKNLAVNFRRRF